MRSVRSELRDSLEGSFYAREHGVQSFREVSQFIPGLRHFKTAGEILRADLLCCLNNAVYWLQRFSA